MWHIVEPATVFIDGWHLHAICDHLEAQSRGDIRNLLINIPPRCAKSLIVSVFWFVWDWIKKPHLKWMCSSYGQPLSTRDSLRCRRLIGHPYFQAKYGHCFSLTTDQRQKTRFDNNYLGYRIATSIGGIGTGDGGDRIVCFTGDTLIDLEFGQLSIREIVENRVSGKICSFSVRKNKQEFQYITDFFKNQASILVKLTLSNNKTLRCTENHPVFNVSRGGYVEAAKTQAGECLLGADGEQQWVQAKEILEEVGDVYNLEVSENNNYYANGILVHNCDDPHKTLEKESDAKLEEARVWWSETMGSRANDQKTVTRTVIMQRVGCGDLSAMLIEQGNYEHLCLPMEYTGRIFVSSIGFSDPRTEIDELLWPERVGPKELAELKIELKNPAAIAGQLQQEPYPAGGTIVQESWFKYIVVALDNYQQMVNPKFTFILQSWDTAFGQKQVNDSSVCTTWGIFDQGACLIDMFKGKPDFPDLSRRAIMLANQYRPNRIIIEKKASGQSLIQTLKRETNLPIIGVECTNDKETRLSAVSTYIQSGRVFIRSGAPWIADFLGEVCAFPNGMHDDIVDSMTHALADIFRKPSKKGGTQTNLMGR